MKVARRVRVFELDGAVMDVEVALEDFTDVASDPLALGGRHVEKTEMAGERRVARAQAPDVHVVHFAHARNTQDGPGHVLQAHAFGEALEQNVRRVGDDADGGPDNHAGNQKGQQRVNEALAGAADEPGAGNDAEVRQRVTQVVKKHGAQI